MGSQVRASSVIASCCGVIYHFSFFSSSPFDFLYYRPYYGGYYGTTAVRDPEEMGFLESVFSYIFGDGNPNEGLEERRLSLVANMIRENQGSVTAEQLAPYCDDAPPPNPNADLQAYVDEVRNDIFLSLLVVVVFVSILRFDSFTNTQQQTHK